MGEIKPLGLLNVLRKIEKLGALEKMRKVRQRCSEVFHYAITTGRAEYNPAAAPSKYTNQITSRS